MKISIVIPFYNSEKTLKRCIESLLAQKNVDLEIVLVNDSSTDKSLVLCQEYEQREERIILINSISQGVSAARNRGLDYCTGDLVGFCDSDDFYADDILEKVCDFFENNSNCDLLITAFNVRCQNGKTVYRGLRTDEFAGNGEKEFSLILNNPNVMGAVWNKFFKRELIGNIRFNSKLSLCEDTHFCLQYVSENRGLNISIIPLVTYFYCQNVDSVTQNEDKIFGKDENLKYYEFLDLFSEEYTLGNFVKGQIECARARLAYETFIGFELNNDRKNKLILEIKSNYYSFIRYGYEVGIKAFLRMAIGMLFLKGKVF